MIEMSRVNSSNIHSIGYDSDAQTLQVTFATGSTYTYHGVPPSLAAGMRQSESKMQFLNAKIKGRFEHRKMK